MLARSLWKLFATMCSNSKIINNSQKSSAVKDNRSNKTGHFRIKMDRINDSLYFMELINNQHPLSQTNRMLENIVRGGTPINRNNFDTIFKKYSFYIQHIHERKGYTDAGFNEKVRFLDNVTQVYSKLGEVSGVNMLKTFNKVSNQIYSQIRLQLKNQSSPDSREQIISKLVLTICCIGRYNKKKSISCYKSVQKLLVNHKYLSRMSERTAILYMELFSKLKVYNRLIIQVCIDTLKDRVVELTIQDLNKTLYCLASSQYPVNKTFVVSITKRITKQLNKQIDPNSGVPYAKNQFAVRQNLRMLQSLSLLQVNMNLASAFLSEITVIYEIQLFELSNYLHRMNDKDLQYYSGLLRRSSYYDETLLKALISEVISRKIRELEDLEFDQGQNQMKKQKNIDKKISINTLCSILHTLAVFNYRNQGLIQYFIKTIQLLRKKQKYKQINTIKSQNQKNLMNIFSNGNLLQEQKGIINLIQPKYYSRVIWALCVIAQKQEIAQIYPFFEYFFIQHYQTINEAPQTHQLLNFYYCYLLLKTYFPKHKLSFQNLLNNLQNKQLQSKISLTHAQIHEQFINAGIPALRQHNINNLMCDIFVPQYTCQAGKYEAANVIIDVHGHHHFMRNCDRLRGNGALKQKILENEGYIYQFIGVHEWELANNKKQFITALMDKIAEKCGKLLKNINKKADNSLKRLEYNEKDGLIPVEGLQNQIEQQTTSRIKLERKRGRSFRTNSLKLSNKWKQEI